jgi:hypothetical protein
MRALLNRLPSAGTVLGFAAFFVALGGSAVAVTSAVNIADGRNPQFLAAVDRTGRVQIGQAPATQFFHKLRPGFNANNGCVVIASPPENTALIVRQIRLDVFVNPSPGNFQNVFLYADTTCSTEIGDVHPPTVGQFTVTFDPGLGIPAGAGISAFVQGSVSVETFTDGYTVPKSAVPSSNIF